MRSLRAYLKFGSLPLEAAEKEENQRENDAYQYRRRKREVESCVLSAIENIARKSSQRQATSTEKHDNPTDHEQGQAKPNQQLSQAEHWLSLTLAQSLQLDEKLRWLPFFRKMK